MSESITVLPIINTNHGTHIAAKLSCPPYLIVGQNQISHPSSELVPDRDARDDEDGSLPPGTLATLNGTVRNVLISKSSGVDNLHGKIERAFYVNPYGNEVHLFANPKVINALLRADVLIYSIGSLFTRYRPSIKGILMKYNTLPHPKRSGGGNNRLDKIQDSSS